MKNKLKISDNIVSSFIDGLIFFDKEKEIVLINKKAEKILNINKKQIINKKAEKLINILGLEIITKNILNNSKNFVKKELKINEKTIETYFIYIKNEGTLIVLHDITKEKIIEQMKNEFVSIVAHQLRNPISSIKWTLKMFIEKSFGPINQEQEKYLEKIYNINEKMVELIKDLLNIARIEEGRYVYQPVLTDISELIEMTINQAKEKAELKKVNLYFKKPTLPIKSVVDPEKIKLVLQNLIDNAIKYNKEKGEVFISIKKDKKDLIVSIKDTGIGIPKKQQGKIFSKFFRAANAFKQDNEGSGLGLYINQELVSAHKGKIWFKSTEGKGTVFCFSLPLQKK
jgi:signal transduction histidine kinase